jgi:hypothetical protein
MNRTAFLTAAPLADVCLNMNPRKGPFPLTNSDLRHYLHPYHQYDKDFLLP